MGTHRWGPVGGNRGRGVGVGVYAAGKAIEGMTHRQTICTL